MSKYSDHQIFIRHWQEQDITSCAKIARRASGLAAWKQSDYQHSFDQGHFGCVAIWNKKIIGCLVGLVTFETADLLDLQLLPEYHGQNIAKNILQFFLIVLCAHKVENLLLEVRASNSRAIRFYEKNSFENIGRRLNYYAAREGLPVEDALIFQRRIYPKGLTSLSSTL